MFISESIQIRFLYSKSCASLVELFLTMCQNTLFVNFRIILHQVKIIIKTRQSTDYPLLK